MPTMVGEWVYHRGVGLLYYRDGEPFMAKLLGDYYIKFWVTSYIKGGWPRKQFFPKTFAMEWAYHITYLLCKTFYG